MFAVCICDGDVRFDTLAAHIVCTVNTHTRTPTHTSVGSLTCLSDVIIEFGVLGIAARRGVYGVTE